MDNELLVKSIRKLCKKNNIAVSQLESDLNFGAGLISRWIKSSPSLDKIVDIADYFHVSIDEVVGRNNIVKDKFLEKLISQTEQQIIQWNVYDNENEEQPKQYFGFSNLKFDDFRNIDDFNDFISFHKEVSYYIQINNKYISLYGQYNGYNVTKPEELKLFIQTSNESELIPQEYNTQQLIPLWLKVLYTMGTSAPDEIKAEEFKNDFINTPENLTNEKIEEFLSDPSILKLIETVDTKEFQKVRQTFENPEFKSAMAMLNSLQSYFDKSR